MEKKKFLRFEIAKKLHISEKEILKFVIQKKSLDARDKANIHYVYEVDVAVENEKKLLKRKNKDVFLTPREKYQMPVQGKEVLSSRPVVVGSGPAGLFCAYMLAEQGYRPLIIERGER